jgi:NAD+ diphosphatase
VINWALASDLDRVDHHRTSTAWVAGLWRAADARLLKLDDQSRFTTNAGGSKLRMTKPFVEFDSQRHLLLGMLDGSPIFAVEALTEGEVHDFREVGALLSDNQRDIAATATALTQWHRAEPRCPLCGDPSRVINGGFARHCLTCAHDHFPRTDPAVIVAVLDDQDRILLGRQSVWPSRRVSILAGFVEAGESLEQAIHREIGEEVDVSLSAVRYYGSQPWPFPRSLMLGFAARASSTAICVDGNEIESAAWYSRDDVRRQVASGELGLPGETSIAFRLIESWLQEELTV